MAEPVKPPPAPGAATAATPIRFQPQITIPHFYFNGLELNSTLSDMGMFLLLDGQPQARLSMSFTMAKTMSENLSKAVASFEKATNHQIMTMDEVKIGFEKNRDK